MKMFLIYDRLTILLTLDPLLSLVEGEDGETPKLCFLKCFQNLEIVRVTTLCTHIMGPTSDLYVGNLQAINQGKLCVTLH
jgi:hypothetical protein